VSAGTAGRESRTDTQGSVRLGLLASAGDGLADTDALLLALQQATAELRGLGGLAHLRDPGSGALRLVTASGLAPRIAEAWSTVRQGQDVAPVRAVCGGACVWLAGDTTGTGASGMVSVPLPGPETPVGTLSVLTGEAGEPDQVQRSVLLAVAAWAAGRLIRSSASGARPSVDRALRGMSDGFLVVDEHWRITFANKAAERLLGTGPSPLGSVLWDVPAGRVPGLEGQCRRAAAEGRPISFELSPPTGRRVHQVRMDPVGDGGGMTITFADVTDQRQRPGHPEAGGAAGRTARMGELTMALAEAVSSKDVVRAVAEHVLPPIGAEGLIVEALESGRVRVIGSAGYSKEFISRIDGVTLADNTAVTDALRTRTPRFVESKGDFVERYPKLRRLTARSNKKAWAFLPLIASGRAIGCCVVSFTRPRSFDEQERTLLTALSGLVAQALERARLYDKEHIRAQELQRGLLPRVLPALPAVSAAAQYLPAGRGDEVGGDWYDVIPLSADRVALVIGDVMGHGIAEAATMGRLRTALRTLADLELEPDELLGHLNELVGELGHDSYATCAYAVFDPVTRICSLALAGHPPPVVVHPDGTVRSPDVTVNPPLGAAEPPFDVHELHLPEESLLVFCTDGLVESGDRDLDEGLAQLRQTLAGAVGRTPYLPAGHPEGAAVRLDDLCDAVVSALLPHGEPTNDDAALLIARTRGTPAADIASCSLPEDPRAAGQAREYVRRQLAAWELDELVMTTELLVSELVGNVVRHAKGPIRLRMLRSRSLICEVYDGSLTTPRIRRAGHTDEGGRGLHLVAALSRRWGTRFLGAGKCIWTEQDLPLRR
jgi:PAS domain-containing protein